jgi:hypothetical protein
MPGTEQPTDGLVKEHITDEVRRSPQRRRAVLVLLAMTLPSSLLHHLIAKSSGLRDVGKNILVAD